MTSSPLRLAALRRQTQAQDDATLPMQSVTVVRSTSGALRRINRSEHPANYWIETAPHSDLKAQLDAALARYRQEHRHLSPNVVSINPTTLLRYLQQVAPEVFVIEAPGTADGVITLEIGEELPENMLMCYRQQL